ncbi:MAG: methyltransferase domain-containing protein [bacterium]|nr:methyltransferase domain-containing protein [bacterium]
METFSNFFQEKITRIFKEKENILDIGGGLRIDKKRNNRYEKDNAWIIPLALKTDYKIMDQVPDYNPDVVGDIHQMPFADNSLDAVICMSVLEHVENPLKACEEIHRVLKVGGYAFVYVPFLYYYHAERGYYHDYWRFTKDVLPLLFKKFLSIEISSTRGAIEAWIKLSPLGRSKLFCRLAGYMDTLTGKSRSNQVSGYNIFLIK